MTYNEIARRTLERQGIEEWLGPKAMEKERAIHEEYRRREKKTAEETPLPRRRQSCKT